jgi:hypothetical protein
VNVITEQYGFLEDSRKNNFLGFSTFLDVKSKKYLLIIYIINCSD